MKEKLRHLPSVDRILQQDAIQKWLEQYPQDLVKRHIQTVLDQIRANLLKGIDCSVTLEDVMSEIDQVILSYEQPSLKPLVNATGTILHTNLGRSLLAREAIEAMNQVASHYNNLEYDLALGHRGSRYSHMKELLVELTGAEDALVVNNNAAAVLLMLTTLIKNKEVLISRGELVEVGGGFRIPEVITSGGAILKEVGSTNKTRLSDYESAISEQTGALIRVHTSNYKIVGFTEQVANEALVALAHKHGLPALNDLGSGLFYDLSPYGLPYEPTVKETIAAGYDVVTFSGDKLLGGPQAGIIVGKKEYLDQMRQNPLLRALRTDKFTLAALEATFRLYLNPDKAKHSIPVVNMITMSASELKMRAENFAKALQAEIPDIEVVLEAGYSQIGGGSYPGVSLETTLIKISHQKIDGTHLERQLRLHEFPVITRLQDDKVVIDMRTVNGQFSRILLKIFKHILID